ncbi:Chlamydia protein associating with death domains [Rickettsiales bacterium Ac37b]|nr:Chlamydia protein associating with death domains [Rickettsiales bacterium Ac37b]
MNNFTTKLIELLKPYHLLSHPFYEAWSCGALDIEILKSYACQYFQHVNAFPRYLSAIHTNCKDIKTRQVILDNLVDEEKGDENHPELWARFAEALGVTREELNTAEVSPETNNLVSTFFKLSQSSVAEGIGALFTYEYQVPSVAKSKIEGLAEFYGIAEERGTKFFTVHMSADEWHSEECANLLNQLTASEQEKAQEAALTAAKALWQFLDGMEKIRVLH